MSPEPARAAKAAPPKAVTNPLSLRLLRRLLLTGVLCILPLGLGRGWVEYRSELADTARELGEIEQTLGAAVARSLWEFNQEQMNLLLDGCRGGQVVTYAAVIEKGKVVAESGVASHQDLLERRYPLLQKEPGRTLNLGTLVLQADLGPLRGHAVAAGMRAAVFSGLVVAIIAAVLFLQTRELVSRHLEALARHFEGLGADPGESGFPSLRLDKPPAGDELDMLVLAVNRMQGALAHSYTRLRAAEAEAASQARFPLENPSPVMRADANGVLLMANKASVDMLEHLGTSPGQPLPEAQAQAVAQALRSGRIQRFQLTFDGRCFDFAASPVVEGGYVNIYGMDMSEREKALEEAKAALTEKSVLLKEIHHRVKNNLQVVSSLLFLQSEKVAGDVERELFRESQQRIQAMALVHEELYGAEDLARVDMREYAPRLAARVLSAAEGSIGPVELDCQVEEIHLPVTLCVPCGLVLNELVMNAVKHAFRRSRLSGRSDFGGGQPRLVVRLVRRAGMARLTVRDNGPGLPQDFEIGSAETLGMTLVAGLAQQLGGSVTALRDGHPGAAILLEFPLPPEESSPPPADAGSGQEAI